MKTRNGEEKIAGWTTYCVYVYDACGLLWLYRADGVRRSGWADGRPPLGPGAIGFS